MSTSLIFEAHKFVGRIALRVGLSDVDVVSLAPSSPSLNGFLCLRGLPVIRPYRLMLVWLGHSSGRLNCSQNGIDHLSDSRRQLKTHHWRKEAGPRRSRSSNQTAGHPRHSQEPVISAEGVVDVQGEAVDHLQFFEHAGLILDQEWLGWLALGGPFDVLRVKGADRVVVRLQEARIANVLVGDLGVVALVAKEDHVAAQEIVEVIDAAHEASAGAHVVGG